MIEAYKIAASLNITGDANKKMTEFSRFVEKATKSTEALQKVLKLVNFNFKGMNRELEKLNPQLQRLDRTFATLGVDLRRTNLSMNYFNESLIGAEGNTMRLKHQTDTLRNSMRSLAAASREARVGLAGAAMVGGGRSRSGRGAGGGGGGGGGGAAPYMGGGYNYGGVTAAEAGAAGLGMGMLGRHVTPIAAAYTGYRTLKSTFNETGEYNKDMASLQAMGYNPAEIARAKQLTGTMNYGAAPSTLSKSFVSAAMATQSPALAEKLFPVLTTGTMAAERLFGGMSSHQVEGMIRGAEMRGGSDEAKIAKEVGMVLMMTAMSGGSIMPMQQQQIISKMPLMSREGYMSLEPVIQEMKGTIVATGLRTGVSAFTKGMYTKPQAEALKAHGWLGDVEYDKNGRPMGSKYGAFKPLDIFQTDPRKFLQDVVLPEYAKSGWTSQKDIAKHIIFEFPRTTADVLVNLLKNLEKSNRISENIKRIPEGGEVAFLSSIGAPEAIASQQLGESWKNFSIALGRVTDPILIKGLEILTISLNKFADVLGYFPKEATQGATNSTAQYFGAGLTLGFGNQAQSNSRPSAVYLDGKKVGSIILNANNMVEQGTTLVNPSLFGASSAVDGAGLSSIY